MKEESEKPLTDIDSNVTETGSSAPATHVNNGGTITPNEAQEPAAKPDQIVLTHRSTILIARSIAPRVDVNIS
jgi:hypothetical protein